jgi:hypothetical protein
MRFLLDKTNNEASNNNRAANNNRASNNNGAAEARSRRLKKEKQTIEKGSRQLMLIRKKKF